MSTILLGASSVQLCAIDVLNVPSVDDYKWPLQVTWSTPDSKPESYTRKEIAGPFWEERTSEQESWYALRPLYLKRNYIDSPIENYSSSFLYPLFNYHEYEGHSHWNILNLIRSSTISTSASLTNGSTPDAYYRKAFEVFPFYFDHDSAIPEYDYFGILPFYGELKNRLFYDRISWVGFPLYSKWEKRDETTYALLWPFLRYRTGPHSSGFAVWPLVGNFQRENDYHYRFALWPFLYYHQKKLYSETPDTHLGILPFYARETRHGYQREDFIWPFFGYTQDDINNYTEARFLWPLFIQGRGHNRYINQIAPFYSISKRNGVDSTWIMWPLYNRKHYVLNDLEIEKQKVLYFLYQNTKQTLVNRPDIHIGTKRHLWPLFSYRETGDGVKQFQMFSPLEPLFPSNAEIRKLYSPLFSIFRYQEISPENRDIELLFSLIHFQQRPEFHGLEIGPLFGYEIGDEKVRFELLKGLLSYIRENGRKTFKLFWFSIDLGPVDPTEETLENE